MDDDEREPMMPVIEGDGDEERDRLASDRRLREALQASGLV